MIEIEKFYKREVVEAMFFGYVNALRMNFPAMSLQSIILDFQKRHGLNEDLMNLDTATSTYYRMEKEYVNLQKKK